MAAEALITPPGEVLYASVLTPKTVNRGKPNEKQQFGIILLQADPEKDPTSKTFIGSLHKQFMDKFGGNAKYGPNGRPWKKEVVLNPDGSETPTGLVRITFSRDLATRSGMELPPPIVQDSKNQPWPANLAIGNGSVCRLAYSIYCWDNEDGGKGMTLNLLAVRVISHVPYVAGGVDPGVFGAAEDGVDVSTLAPEHTPGDLFVGPTSTEVPWD